MSGPFGAGKTTLAVRRLGELLRSGVPGDAILVSAPRRSGLRPYQAELARGDLPSGPRPLLLTLGGLARQMVELFWPAVAPEAGFARPAEPPVFLTHETAQFYMARVIGPLIAEAGYFEGIHAQPPDGERRLAGAERAGHVDS